MEKLKNIKAVFLDIDGTLTDSNKQINDSTKRYIKEMRDKGIYVVLCSGRSNADACKYSKETQASEYVISSNGAQIYNYVTNQNFYKDNIRCSIVKDVFKYCNENKLELVLNGLDRQFGNVFFYSDTYKDRVVINKSEELTKIDVYQIIVNSNDYYKMQDFENYIKVNDNGLKIANYSREYISENKELNEPYYMFVNNESADKGTAIKKFLEAMDIKKEETICFGDRINDITMFESCGNTVAMENADVELKKKADYVTLSNDKNGVAEFLKRWCQWGRGILILIDSNKIRCLS